MARPGAASDPAPRSAGRGSPREPGAMRKASLLEQAGKWGWSHVRACVRVYTPVYVRMHTQ
eukprot:14747914-Alexandrium_andersonii.AAC.1